MAKRNQTVDRTRSRRGSKMEDKSQQNKGKRKANSSNRTNNNDENEPEVLIVPSSSSDSQNNENEEEQEEEEEEDVVEVNKDEEDDDEEEQVEAKSSDVTNQRSNSKKEDKKKKKKEEDKKNESAMYCFPMHRINRIIKSEDSDIRITQEAIFLVNKASEKFLELFCKEAYACSFLERKNYVDYRHLSSVVCKRRRFDFLSDFVPEKVKAEAALAEMPSAGT